MAYQIITDSCCDFSTDMYRQIGAEYVPLMVTFRGETYPDHNDESLKDVYAGLRAGEVATTSAANPETWSSAFRKALESGKDVLAMAFSSGLSTTYQSAVIASQELQEEFPDRTILVCDTLCASLGQGLLVWYACKKQQSGMSAQEVYQWVEDNKQHLCHWFTVDDLMFLKRGGRISAATALVGTMLSVKPVLHVDSEGHLINVSKARGRKAAINALVQKAVELSAGYENEIIFISHGDCREEAEALAETIREKLGVKEIYINFIGPVIGAHSGPGTLALFFMGEHR